MLKTIFVISLVLSVQIVLAQNSNSSKRSPISIKNSETAVKDGINKITFMSFDYSSQTDSSLTAKDITEFDAAGNLISHSTYSWDKYNIIFMKEDKYEFEYDMQGNEITNKYWYGDYSENNLWIKNRIIYTHFDQNNMEIQKVLVGLNMSAELDTLEIHRKEYNEKNIISIATDSIKHFVDNTFNWDITKTKHFYDENDTTINQYKQDVSDGEWVISYSTYSKFNTNNQIIETSSTDGVNWGNLIKYAYNSDGLLDSVVSYRPINSGDSIVWELTYKANYKYNSTGDQIQITQWGFDTVTKTLYIVRQTDYTYDANRNITEILEKLADQDHDLVKKSKTTFVFDESNNLTETTYYTYNKWDDDNPWTKQQETINSYTDGLLRIESFYNGNNSVPSNRNIYYYNSETITQSRILVTTDITVFPNPTEDFVVIHLSELVNKPEYSIFDLSGKLIAKKDILSTDAVVNMSAFKDGTYIFKINDKREILKTFKIVKR